MLAPQLVGTPHSRSLRKNEFFPQLARISKLVCPLYWAPKFLSLWDPLFTYAFGCWQTSVLRKLAWAWKLACPSYWALKSPVQQQTTSSNLKLARPPCCPQNIVRIASSYQDWTQVSESPGGSADVYTEQSWACTLCCDPLRRFSLSVQREGIQQP